jgi:hypothetical protein
MASREDILAGIFFAIVGSAIPAVVVTHHFFGIDPMAFAALGVSRYILGSAFAMLAAAVSILNLYLAYLVPWLYQREHGTMQDYSSASGLPIISGFFVLFAGALLPTSPAIGVVLLLIYCADSLGLPRVLLLTAISR